VTSSTPPVRLPGPARRRQIVDVALRAFANGSYTGTTTAEIARVAGVSEPIIYRHFPSKRELWFACLDEAWTRFSDTHEAQLAGLGGNDRCVEAFTEALDEMRASRVLLTNLWLQGLTEAGADDGVRRYVRRHIRDAQGFVADGLRRGQASGGIVTDRDADAEAWITIAVALLASFADRLGGVLTRADLDAIRDERLRWLIPPRDEAGETAAGVSP
jgi:TetR/AcrR family transcriptional regulator